MQQQVFQQSLGDRDNALNYAIIITDGNSNINSEKTIPQAIEARVNGVHIIVIAIGTDVNRIELEGMASEPKNANIFTLNSINSLMSIKDQIVNSICNGMYKRSIQNLILLKGLLKNLEAYFIIFLKLFVQNCLISYLVSWMI